MDSKDFIKILDEMDIPNMRREINRRNLQWLMRNIRIRNGKHPKIKEVIEEIKRLLKACNLD
ncbi:MAG: hypothetical protein EBY39_11030 [Flavobacteriia bacterium]|nr:hypothetical protein [Flavobacteriia bacterium]